MRVNNCHHENMTKTKSVSFNSRIARSLRRLHIPYRDLEIRICQAIK